MASDQVTLEQAIAAAQGLAKMLVEEFPSVSPAEIIETWSAFNVTPAERAAVAVLEREGLLSGA